MFFEGKRIEVHIKWWNPIQVSRTVPSNALVALLNKGPIAYLLWYGFYPLSGQRQWVVPSISLTGWQSLATVVLCYTAFGTAHLPWDSPLDYLCVFGCAAYASLPKMLQDRKLAPSGIVDMHVGHDLGSSLEGGTCIQSGRARWDHFFTGGCNSNRWLPWVRQFHQTHAGTCLL